MHYYLVKHITAFEYSAPIRETVMEVRSEPRTEGNQRCLSFEIATKPPTTVFSYLDAYGNRVHHFDVPGAHDTLSVAIEASVEMREVEPLPEQVSMDTWETIDRITNDGEQYEWLVPSTFASRTDLSDAFMKNAEINRDADPVTMLRKLNRAIFDSFDYLPQSTRSDSTIDVALTKEAGVCQDFSHIMITCCRALGIPARYVSGYLFHRRTDHERDRSADDATHAWIEAWLPEIGWIGFDPTNNLLASERHIRVAVGRDFSDVPPNRGVFKGEAEESLSVAVRVFSIPEPLPDPPPRVRISEPPTEPKGGTQQ